MNINSFIGQTITGQQLNLILNGMPVLKFMNNNDIHYGMHYVTGRNQDIRPFNNSGHCCSGGLYVTTLENYIHYYLTYGNYARRVRIDPGAKVYVEANKLKCNEIYLEDRILKDELLRTLFAEYTETLINQGSYSEIFFRNLAANDTHCMYLKFINFNTFPHLIIEAMRQNGLALVSVDEKIRTPEMMIEAMRQNGLALQYVRYESRTPEMVIEAVRQNGLAIRFANERTMGPDIILEAVRQNGSAIRYIKRGMLTNKMRLEAMKQDGLLLRYVRSDAMTPDVILEALKQNPQAFEYVEKKTRKRPEIKEIIEQYCR
jgi:hypothetical protein